MHFAILIPGWNSLDSVRRAHSDLEAAALVFFALLVIFDVLAHLSDDKGKERVLEKIGLCFFAVAVLAEIVAYPYGQRNDTLSEQVIVSLDAKARTAATNASIALTDSGTALSQSKDALGKAEAAKGETDSFKTDIVSVRQRSTDLQSHLIDDLERTKRLEGQLSWRSMSPEQIEVLKRHFCPSRFPKLLPFLGMKVGFSYINGDAEAGEYAEELAAALRSTLGRLGAEIAEPTSVTVYGNGPPQRGLLLQAKDARDALGVTIQNGLKQAGVDAPGEITQGIVEGGNVGLYVAIKPKKWTAMSSAEIQKQIAALPTCGN